jgi:hypothetical protein
MTMAKSKKTQTVTQETPTVSEEQTDHLSKFFEDIDRAYLAWHNADEAGRPAKRADVVMYFGIAGDWLDDNERLAEAEAYRYLVLNDKRPYTNPNSQSGTEKKENKAASWFNKATVGPGLGSEESDLPAELYAHLQGGKETANHKSYDDIRAAVDAFVAAYTAWDKVEK